MYIGSQILENNKLTPKDVEITYPVFRAMVDKLEIKIVTETLGYEDGEELLEDDDSVHYYTTMKDGDHHAYIRIGNNAYLFTADPLRAKFVDGCMFYWTGLYLNESYTYEQKKVTYHRVVWEDDDRTGTADAPSYPEAVKMAMVQQMYSHF